LYSQPDAYVKLIKKFIRQLPSGPIFDATVQVTEEAIVNALVAARDMTGVDGHTVTALPHDGLQQALKNTTSRVTGDFQ